MNIPLQITILIAIIIFIWMIGLYLSRFIIDTTEYVFFWFLYILSFITLANIFGGVYYYSVMKNKTGPRGPKGIKGEEGDIGDTGRCNVECRNNMCQIGSYQHIIDTLNTLEKSYGDLGNLTVDTDLRNPYIKEKVKSICQSLEYQQMAPIKGVEPLNKYIQSVWTDITTRLYNSGGLNYFRTIGAEYDWDWLDENPWDEFKKYDIYYWGMGHEYRPRLKEIEIDDNTAVEDGETDEFPINENRKTGDNEMVEAGKEMVSTTDKKDAKYSILGYINIPTVEEDGKSVFVYKKDTGERVRLYNVHTFVNSDEVLSQYSKTRNIKYLNPLSFMIADEKNSNKEKCISVLANGKNNKYRMKSGICNTFNPDYIFNIDLISTKESKLNEFKLQHTSSGKYFNGNKLADKTNATIYVFKK